MSTATPTISPVLTVWLDFALDKAHDAGWHVHWGDRQTSTKTNTYGPRIQRTEHWVRLYHPDGNPIGDEFVGVNRDAAAWCLVQRFWPPADDKAEETA